MELRCEWYALCDRPADGLVRHIALGLVPVCKRCADLHDLEFEPANAH